jgi:shikimate kinase
MSALILIGPPGSGKSTIGRLVGERLERPWIDTDLDIEERSGKKISDIFVEEGEAVFRQWESESVLRSLAVNDCILSLGGGAVMTESIFQALEASDAFIVYLSVGIASAAPRIGFNRDRPLLLVNPRQQWLSLYEKRRPIYEELADLTLSTDEAAPADMVNAITEAWRARDASY